MVIISSYKVGRGSKNYFKMFHCKIKHSASLKTNSLHDPRQRRFMPMARVKASSSHNVERNTHYIRADNNNITWLWETWLSQRKKAIVGHDCFSNVVTAVTNRHWIGLQILVSIWLICNILLWLVNVSKDCMHIDNVSGQLLNRSDPQVINNNVYLLSALV